MKFFDAHLHVVPESVLRQAQLKGVTQFICNATSQNDWNAVESLSKRVLGVYTCYGIHPWFVHTASADWGLKLEEKLAHNPTAMVGEVGLDRLRPAYEKQKEIFIRSLQLAVKYNRIVHVHCVKAWDDMFEILGEFRELSFLFHRFNGDEIVVQKLRFVNAYFSIINGNCLNVIPDNRLLVESDAPDGLKSPENIPELVRALHLDRDYLSQNWERFLYDR